jgi:membrane fusion protein, multidrug efflux system
MSRWPICNLSALSPLLLCALAACSKAPQASGPAGTPEVGVVTLQTSAVTLTRELPGRTSSFRIAEVRARVNGIVQRRLFEEGADVKAGQLLYVIDPAPYQAALSQAKAQLARADATVSNARVQEARLKELVAKTAVSQQDYDNAAAALKTAEADLEAGKAAVELAGINLGYTRVTSPVPGRIGRSAVTEGAYVQSSQATLLAVVQQLDPVYVDVSQSSAELLRLRRDFEEGKLKAAGKGRAKVTLVLEDGRDYGAPGELQFADVTVDPGTGSVVLRALFPNPKGELLPGMFVRARLEEGVSPEALLVPQQAVSRDRKGTATALVVNADKKVEQRELQADRAVGTSWLVSAGVKAGEQVIVEGLQRARPGSTVNPVPAGSIARPAQR